MSRITRVRVTSPLVDRGGLKGQQFDFELTGCDLLVGPNGSGKTTRGPLAIAAAIEGLAATPTDPRRPHIGPAPVDVVVHLDLDDGRTLTRQLDARPGTKAAREADQQAHDLIGTPPTAWNLSDFATGTDGDRHRIVDAVARAGGQLESWDTTRAQHHTMDLVIAQAPTDDPAEMWTQPYNRCLSALATARSAADWLRAATDWATDHQKQANAAQREADGLLTGLNDNPPPAPKGTEKAAQKAHRAALTALAVLDTGRRDLGVVAAARARHQSEGQRLADQLAATEREGHRLGEAEDAPVPPDTGHIRQRIDEAKQALGEEIKSEPSGDEVCRHCGQADPLGSAERVTAGIIERLKANQKREIKAATAALVAADNSAIAAQDSWAAREAARKERLNQARGRWAETRKALDEWADTEPPAIPAEPDPAVRAEAEALVASTAAVLDPHRDHAAHIARVAEAAEAYTSRRLYWDASRALVAALRQARDDMAAAAYAPIEAAAVALVDGAVGLPVPYFVGPEDYGAVSGLGIRVPFAALSESEQRITAAALAYALATVAGCPCRLVLVDGLEVVQHDHRVPLLAALARARKAGLVDTVVVTMATAPGDDLGYLDEVAGLIVHPVAAKPKAEPKRKTKAKAKPRPNPGEQVEAPF